MQSKLQPGNYMKVSKVIDFLENNFKTTLLDVVKKACPTHEGEFDIYYSTTDLRNLIVPSIFQELECEVVTHMILTEEELSSINSSKISKFKQISLKA